nr:hypothetical protein [Candidatus Sigynarchaeota archaeon]
MKVEDLGQAMIWAAHFFNLEDFSQVRLLFLQNFRSITNMEIPDIGIPDSAGLGLYYAFTLMGFDEGAQKIGAYFVDLIKQGIHNVSQTDFSFILLSFKEYSLVKAFLNRKFAPRGRKPFMDLDYDYTAREGITYDKIVAEFSKAIVRNDFQTAKRIMDHLRELVEMPVADENKILNILGINFYQLFIMARILNDAGVECGNPGKVYRRWLKWIADNPLQDRTGLAAIAEMTIKGAEARVMFLRNATRNIEEFNLRFKSEFKDKPKPLKPSVVGNPRGEDSLENLALPENIEYYYVSVAQLLELPLCDYFTENGEFQDECGVDIMIQDILGADAMAGGHLPYKLGDYLNARDLVKAIKSNAAFQECLRHIALHGDFFTGEQPEDEHGIIFNAIIKHLPEKLSNSILQAILKSTDVIRLIFDDREIRKDILRAMTLALEDMLDSYIADWLKRLVETTSHFLDEHGDALLLICAEI